MAIDKNIIQSLLNDIESDRAERTISVNNTDKFGQAICAFANDLPNHGKPGYLIIGADDKTGKVIGLNITDELLKNLSAIRTDGVLQDMTKITGDIKTVTRNLNFDTSSRDSSSPYRVKFGKSTDFKTLRVVCNGGCETQVFETTSSNLPE